MTEKAELDLGARLRGLGPGGSDPLFRLRVIERRELRRFRARAAVAGVLTAGFLGLAAAGAARLGEGALESAGVLLFGVVIATAAVLQGPRAVQLLRRRR